MTIAWAQNAGQASVVLHLWGDFTATTAAGDIITPRSRKARALLAWLALHPDRPVSRERLCGLLWGGRAEDQARASLRQALFELKAFVHGSHACLTASRSHIWLHSAAIVTDLQAGACQEPGEHLLADLDDMDEGFDDWLRFERARQEARVAPASPAATVAAPDIDPHALALYQKGLEIAGPPETRRQSIALFEAALVLAPDFGPCMAALAMTFAWLARWDVRETPYEELASKARDAATRALQRDPRSARAQLALGILQPYGAYAAREAMLDRAVAAAPEDGEVLRQRGEAAYNVGRTREALGLFANAHHTVPDSLMHTQNHAMALADIGALAQSRALYAAARQRWPEIIWLLTDPWLLAANMSDWDYADSLAAAIAAAPGAELAFARFIVSALRSRDPAAQAAVRKVAARDLQSVGFVNLSNLVLACNLGMVDEAFGWIAASSYAAIFEPDGRGPDTSGFYQGVLFGAANQVMRGDPRFVGLCAKLGLNRFWIESRLWPDCADELQLAYGFRDRVRRQQDADGHPVNADLPLLPATLPLGRAGASRP